MFDLSPVKEQQNRKRRMKTEETVNDNKGLGGFREVSTVVHRHSQSFWCGKSQHDAVKINQWSIVLIKYMV